MEKNQIKKIFKYSVCNFVGIPVYAIGGITPENSETALNFDASAVCMMSGLMR